MILPLLVFIVVLITILFSYKIENFKTSRASETSQSSSQTSQSSSQTSQSSSELTQSSSKLLTSDKTIIAFIINKVLSNEFTANETEYDKHYSLILNKSNSGEVVSEDLLKTMINKEQPYLIKFLKYYTERKNLEDAIKTQIINIFYVEDFLIDISLKTIENKFTKIVITINKYFDKSTHSQYIDKLKANLFSGINRLSITTPDGATINYNLERLNLSDVSNADDITVYTTPSQPQISVSASSSASQESSSSPSSSASQESTTSPSSSASQESSASSSSSSITAGTEEFDGSGPSVYIYIDSIKSPTQPAEPTQSSAPEPTKSDLEDHTLNNQSKLSKRTCINTKKNCNVGYKPYSYFKLNDKNPVTKKYYSSDEKTQIKKRFRERCDNEKDSEEKFCCDTEDPYLQKKYSSLPYELRRKFNRIVVDKCNNKINSIKICDNEKKNCNEPNDNPRQATAYELCKLQNIDLDKHVNDEGLVDKSALVMDCYEGRCKDTAKLLELYPEDSNQKITDHYYLIDAVKNNNVPYLQSYFGINSLNNVNERLEYGYPGNTILHQAIFDKKDDIIDYLITLKVDTTKVNKDGNSPFHIACLKGNYNAVHKLIKLGASVNCKNNMSDTPLHCAVRSGSYNTVLILLNNGATAVLNSRNEHGEIPLHTAVVSKKKNFKIVEILVEYGSDIHSINDYNKTVLASLMQNDKTVVRESIRTFLQRMYYNKYSESEYNKLLVSFPEIRPFEIDRDVPDKLKKNFKSYDSSINYKDLVSYDDEYVSNKGLYLDKNTRAQKANIDSKYFDNKNVVLETFNSNINNNNVEMKENNNSFGIKEDNSVGMKEGNNNSVGMKEDNKKKLSRSMLNKAILKNFDIKLMISSFVTLIVFLIIVVVLYVKIN